MQCAPKLVYPSQDQPVRMVVSRWLTSVQDYPWASAWLISPDHARASALQPMDTHPPCPSESERKCSSSPSVTNCHSPWVILPNFTIWSLANHIFSKDFWSCSSTPSLERLDSCCPPTTWLSGFSKDLPTYKVKHSTVSEKDGWSFTNSWKTIKHSGQFSKQTHIIVS